LHELSLPPRADLIRFVNMDYCFLSTVKNEKVKMLKVSYDVGCSWIINLFRRIALYPPDLRIAEGQFLLECFIPKFHLPAHGPKCHTRYSFNYRPGVGRTHGENIESSWAHTNPAAVATREMGAGARHSALDGHWAGWNWRKVTGFGMEFVLTICNIDANICCRNTSAEEFPRGPTIGRPV